MQSTRYFEPNLPGILALPATGAATIAPIERVRSPRGATLTVRTIERSISLDEVCELIAAAGPLTVADIAGGLDAPAGQVAAYVQSMVGHGDLQEDEFGRYVLRGHCLEQS